MYFISEIFLSIFLKSIRIFNELKTKLHDTKEYKEKLLITLSEFLEDHFPLPDRSAKKKKVSFRRYIHVFICGIVLDRVKYKFYDKFLCLLYISKIHADRYM